MKNNQSGFTFIELLIVIIIITTLVSLAYVAFTEYMARTYDAQSESTYQALRKAYEAGLSDRIMGDSDFQTSKSNASNTISHTGDGTVGALLPGIDGSVTTEPGFTFSEGSFAGGGSTIYTFNVTNARGTYNITETVINDGTRVTVRAPSS